MNGNNPTIKDIAIKKMIIKEPKNNILEFGFRLNNFRNLK